MLKNKIKHAMKLGKTILLLIAIFTLILMHGCLIEVQKPVKILPKKPVLEINYTNKVAIYYPVNASKNTNYDYLAEVILNSIKKEVVQIYKKPITLSYLERNIINSQQIISFFISNTNYYPVETNELLYILTNYYNNEVDEITNVKQYAIDFQVITNLDLLKYTVTNIVAKIYITNDITNTNVSIPEDAVKVFEAVKTNVEITKEGGETNVNIIKELQYGKIENVWGYEYLIFSEYNITNKKSIPIEYVKVSIVLSNIKEMQEITNIKLEEDIISVSKGIEDYLSPLKLFFLGGDVAYLYVYTVPEGADVYLDSKFIGFSPVGPIAVTYGEHFIYLYKEDYKGINERIVLKKSLTNFYYKELGKEVKNGVVYIGLSGISTNTNIYAIWEAKYMGLVPGYISLPIGTNKIEIVTEKEVIPINAVVLEGITNTVWVDINKYKNKRFWNDVLWGLTFTSALVSIGNIGLYFWSWSQANYYEELYYRTGKSEYYSAYLYYRQLRDLFYVTSWGSAGFTFILLTVASQSREDMLTLSIGLQYRF